MNKSNRYIPECIQFLNGALYLATGSKNKDHNKKISDYELSTIFESFKRSKINLSITNET